MAISIRCVRWAFTSGAGIKEEVISDRIYRISRIIGL
jgi:hypothetical protein